MSHSLSMIGAASVTGGPAYLFFASHHYLWHVGGRLASLHAPLRSLAHTVAGLASLWMWLPALVLGLFERTPRPSAQRNSDTAVSTKPGGAIVVGGDFQGLGIVRSLGRKNIPVCVVDDEFSISRFSRYATYVAPVASLREEERTVDTILEIGDKLGLRGWVLFPTRDETVAAFARYRPRLAEFFSVPTPEWTTTQWVWDKRNTYRLANQLDIPTPRTFYPSQLADLDKIDLKFPVAIKPAIKEHFFYATKAKAWRANNAAELRALFVRAAAQVEFGEVMIQDLIPGDGSQQFAYCAFIKDGQALGSMVVRRARQHPPEFGRASTYVETIENRLLEELSLRFLRSIDYYGLVEMEYKWDMRDGQYKLLDVNGRTWGYHTLGEAAGVDFPGMLFADQAGEIVTPCRAQVGVRWIRLTTDLPTAIREIAKGNQSLWAYLKSLRNFDTEAVFSREDPLPGLAELGLLPYLILKRGV